MPQRVLEEVPGDGAPGYGGHPEHGPRFAVESVQSRPDHGVYGVRQRQPVQPAARDQVAHDWAAGASYGAMWRPKIVTAKHRAVTATSRVADLALDVTGGVGIFPSSGLERPIPGCAARADPLSHRFLTREIVVKAALGLDLDEQPRSG